MATRTDSPLVAALLSEVESVYGRQVRTPADFVSLADRIEARTKEHISDSTIKRLWKKSLAYKTVSDRSLNVISQYVGYPHFHAFVEHLAEKGIVDESELVSCKDCINVADLQPGDEVQIAWQPNRECSLKYLGERKFEVTFSINAKIRVGDTFECSSFIPGRPLYVDRLTHEGEVYESYAMGTRHGLIRAVVLREKKRPYSSESSECGTERGWSFCEE